MDEVKDILNNLGYRVLDTGRDYRTKPLYRESSSNTVLSINKSTGRWIDFKEQRYGSLEELIQITLNLKTIDDAKEYLSSNFKFEPVQREKEGLKAPPVFSKTNLESVIPNYSYWVKRGVPETLLKLLQSGVMLSGKMKDRYVFPVFDNRDRIVGCSGRDLTGEHPMKWKHIGEKSKWVYPLKYNLKDIMKSREVFLIESIGDMLALWTAGIKNTIVTHGLHISSKIKQALMVIDPQKIYISFNNDENQAGNNGAKKAYFNLRKQFDDRQLKIALPTENDFGCMSTENILTWHKNLKM